MRKRKAFTKTEGHYFFNVKSGYSTNITISRKSLKEASWAYRNYLKQRKECEWLGQWDGKKFIDTEFEEAA